jgi:hypothetical protein
MQQTVRQRGLAVIYMGNNAKIPDILFNHDGNSIPYF